MVICKEIDYYLKYAEEHPKWINKKRKLLIENIVKPILKRDDVFFDEKTYRDCLQYAFTVTVSSAVNDTSCAQEISCKLNNTLIGQNGNYCKLSSTFCGRCSKGDTILVTSYKNGGEWSMFNTRLIFVPVD